MGNFRLEGEEEILITQLKMITTNFIYTMLVPLTIEVTELSTYLWSESSFNSYCALRRSFGTIRELW